MRSFSPARSGDRLTGGSSPSPRSRALALVLRLVAVAGLSVDAYVHFKLAHEYDAVRATVSEGQLFRGEAFAAITAALLILITWRPTTRALVFAIAASALVTLLVNRYVHIGAIGPLPDMYEPDWFGDKVLTAVAEGVVAVAVAAYPWRKRPA
jgi:hypothetical protein